MKNIIRMISFAVVLGTGALASSVALAGNCPNGYIEISGPLGLVCIPVSTCNLAPQLC